MGELKAELGRLRRACREYCDARRLQNAWGLVVGEGDRLARNEQRKLAAIVAVLFVAGWLTDRDEQCVTLIFIMIGCSIVIQAMRHLQKDNRHD